MMTAQGETTGLILAGGAGRRVGGRDKGLMAWRGQPLVAHVAQRLRPQVGRLLISCNRNAHYYATLGDVTVADERRDFQGPLAGLEAAAPHIGSQFLVITPCDTPLLPPDLAWRLLRALEPGAQEAADISYAHDGVRDQYLCAAIRVAILPTLGGFLEEGQRAVRHWYARHRCRVVDFSDQATCFANYNRMD
jgi:molybdopterin-guanine dinucleotide biosynthesis protein A